MLFAALWLSGCHQDADEAVASFQIQKKKYNSIVNTLKQVRTIKVVEIGMNPDYVANSQNFDSFAASTYRAIEKELSTLNVRKVVAVRNAKNDEQIEAVSFVMKSNHFDWSKAWSIIYIESGKDVEAFMPPHSNCRPIDSAAWNICIYDMQ